MPVPILIIQDLIFRYLRQDQAVLNRLNLKVNAGECIGITGKNGSGKSTLVSLIAGLAQTFARGEVTGRIERAGGKGAPLVILQDPDSQILCERVESELDFFRGHCAGPLRSFEVQEAIRLADLENLRDRYVHKLSYGQKQRVVLASALICSDPTLVVLDEPFAHLDQVGLEHFVRVIEVLKKRGSALVLVGHDLARVSGLIDRFYFLREGILSPLAVCPPPAFPYLSAPEVSGQSDVLLSIRELTCRDSKGKAIFLPFSQELPRRRVCGLSGANGSGKSSLAAVLAGIIRPAEGSIRCEGRPVAERDLRRTVKLVTQNPFRQLLYRTGEQNVRAALGRNRPCLSKEELTHILGVTEFLKRDVISLSRGEALRVALLCSLLEDPELLILDEALVGLDREGCRIFLELSHSLCSRGKGVLLISHLSGLIKRVCSWQLSGLEPAR